MKPPVVLIILVVGSQLSCRPAEKLTVLSAPAGSRPTLIARDGVTVIPNGRLITPVGKTVEVAPHPFGLTLSRDGQTAVTANSGTSPLSLSVIKNVRSETPEILQIPPGVSTDAGILESVFMGIAISPDGKLIYASGGQANKIFLFSVETGENRGFVDCSSSTDGYSSKDGYIGDLVLSEDGKRLFAVDQTNFQILIIDTDSNVVRHAVPTGRYPFGIALSPDERKVYVANVGMFQYKKIPGIDENNMENSGLEFPPFAYGSEEAEKGVQVDSYHVPGLGNPNVPESFSVWAIDISGQTPHTVAKIKTGHLVGAMVEGIPAVGGASPNSIAVTSEYVFVSNGNNDNISVIDIKTDTVVTHIFLKPHQERPRC